MPIMGPIEVNFANRRCYTGAIVLGNEVLLGAIPMKDMDLVLRTQLQDDDFEPGRPARFETTDAKAGDASAAAKPK